MRSRGGRSFALAGWMICLLIAGCGGSHPRAHRPTPVARVVMARAPNSLDPAVGNTPEALEADWLVYTPLLTYAHANGAGGTEVLAGLASTTPVITDGGRTYTLSLRPGLLYSNHEPVRASDFTHAVERALRLHWGEAAQLITPHIAGAAAYAAGRARTISGITAND